MENFWEIIDWISDKMKILGAACLMGMAILTGVDVIGRFFRHPIFGSVELVGFMATMAVALALPYTHKADGHIGVEIIVRLFSEKVQIILEICTGIVGLALFILVTWRMFMYGNTMKESGEVSMNLELPEHLIIYIVACSFFIFSIIIIQTISTNIRKLKNL